jgi:hypothetical protein
MPAFDAAPLGLNGVPDEVEDPPAPAAKPARTRQRDRRHGRGGR